MRLLRLLIFYPLCLLASFTAIARAQNQTNNIALYSKVWGFIKYHHPNVAGGTINWDSVFVAHIDQAAAAKNTRELNLTVSDLIAAAGTDKNTGAATPTGDIFTTNHDLGWLEHSTILSSSNREKLLYIFTHRNRGNNRFVKYSNYTDYSGENPYPQMTWPTPEYRLLFLARFWNAINYYDPYKFITTENWNTILPRFIPKVLSAKDTLAYEKILLQLAVALHDGHAQLYGREGTLGKYLSPFYTTVLGNSVVITHTDDGGLCDKAGIRQGDLLVAINNEPIAKRIARFKSYISSSNSSSLNRGLMYELLRTTDTSEKVTIKRGNKTFTTATGTILAVKRNWAYQNNYNTNSKGYEMIGRSIIKVYTDEPWYKNADSIKALMRSKKAIIFDARGYMDDDAFYSIFDMFLPGPTPIDIETKIMPDQPGFFKWVLTPKIGGNNPDPYSGTVIILVDERCQSQGEYTVMTLQAIPHAVTIGSQTCGLDGVVSNVPMGGGLSLAYSGYGIYYPDKTPTQQRGVRIDIQAPKTANSVIAGRDVALEKAMAYLKARGIE